MGEAKDNEVYEEDFVDYEEEVENAVDGAATNASVDVVKKGYVGIHSSGFRDFLLKPELLRTIQYCGFEHPSEGKVEAEGHDLPDETLMVDDRTVGVLYFRAGYTPNDYLLEAICLNSPSQVSSIFKEWTARLLME